MNAYVFPGQGSQFVGMGRDEASLHPVARELFAQADDILGYALSEVMYEGTEENLRQTRITQPAIFVHSIARAKMLGDAFEPKFAAGHSLGEFSALTATGALTFEDGLRLVYERAEAMQAACEQNAGTMAAIVGLEDQVIEEICAGIDAVVVPANYNCPGQLVISGSVEGIDLAVAKLQEAGAKRAIVLAVGGAFHSPLMAPAQERLEKAIANVTISTPSAPVYQNVTATPSTDPQEIKDKLVAQLTAPVKWTQTMQNLISDGASGFIEVGGRGGVLTGFVRRIDRNIPSESV